MKPIAYAFADGALHFTDAKYVPSGALGIKRCPDDQDPLEFKKEIEGWCRLAHSGTSYLIPGMPEAENQLEAMEAFERFVDVVNGKIKPEQPDDNG